MGIVEWRRGPAVGRGSSATVSLATDCRTGEVFAVKSVEIARAGILRREQSILSALSSPYVVSCVGSDVSAAEEGSRGLWYNMFMEYAPGGSLADEIKKCGGRCDEFLIRSRTHDILRGLAYVHGAGIAHCDIKGRNVLIGSDGRAKIADFGCARWTDDSHSDGKSGQLRGTPMFMAPEAARGEEQGTSADIWALGCTVIEMATGGAPWPQFTDPVAALHHIAFSDDVPELPDWMSEEGKEFLARCLRRDPSERWTAEQLLKHQFVASSSSNCVPKVTPSELWVSPKSILDQGFWEESIADSDATIGPTDRVRALAGGAAVMPDWTWDENWITVRGGDIDECMISPESEAEMDTNPFFGGSTASESSTSEEFIFLGGDHMGMYALHHHSSHGYGFVYGDVSSCNGECSDSFCDSSNMISNCNFASTSNGFCLRCFVTFRTSWPFTFRMLIFFFAVSFVMCHV